MNRSAALALILIGCTGTDDPPLAGTGDTGTEAATTWAEMDFEARQAYMADVVLPTMQAEFEAYDARFADMTCETCHGGGATDGTFALPSDGLYPIDFAALPTGAGADFMSATVVPMMADLLDTDPFDPASGTGFGCAGCHPTQ